MTFDETGPLAKSLQISERISRPVPLLLVGSFTQGPREAIALQEPEMASFLQTIPDLLTAGGSVDWATFDPVAQPAVLQFTGGTTGTPKAAVLTHYDLLVNSAQMVSWYPQLGK